MERKQIPLLSLADSCRVYAQSANGTIEDHGDYIVYRSPSFFYGRTCILRSDDLEKTITEIKNNNPTPICCFTEELIQKDFGDVMTKNGYAPMFVQTGMIFDLDKPFDETVDEHIVVLGPKEAALNADIFEKALGGVPQEGFVSEAFAKEGPNKGQVYAYKDEGIYKASAAALFNEGVSGIHQVGTLPEYLRCGYARALLNRCLQDAKKAGMDQISLQASPAGKLVYDSLGFETVSNIPTFILPPQ